MDFWRADKQLNRKQNQIQNKFGNIFLWIRLEFVASIRTIKYTTNICIKAKYNPTTENRKL